ncbi:ABC transporter permease subunit [Aliidongia sp.]|uniref:ABC transporter permease subunit n=1 Tax=Aliidongia sp. TaxID=1914230 RepID=UPI0032C20FF9
MLVWSRSGRWLAWGFAALLIGIVYVAPLAIILAASFAGQWNDALPSLPTVKHYLDAVAGASGEALWTSVVTGLVASGIALLLGTWAALALRSFSGLPRRLLDLLFFVPSAVPSVSVGLGLLVAFSRPPILLNGTSTIVFVAHLILISAFTYGNVSAGLARMSPDFEQIAESLGARPAYRLRHVTLPLILPHLIAAFSLSFALSMGELGATVMIYPPGWVTLPVGIFSLTDRGDVFEGSALTILLILTTLAVLIGLSRIPAKVAPR